MEKAPKGGHTVILGHYGSDDYWEVKADGTVVHHTDNPPGIAAGHKHHQRPIHHAAVALAESVQIENPEIATEAAKPLAAFIHREISQQVGEGDKVVVIIQVAR